ncbi:MAG: DNA polymerase III subunit alpha [Lactobacillaceae bacterium]|jgi:DNA polymerase-3 subunit alpha|nr:DNA polymerase III subunit alpha [Lactobacillaceae bacterium]
MPETKFVHLRVHTAFSLSEGAMKIKALLPRAKAMGFSALAITDTANMFGVKEFSASAPKEGIKPIVGCQFYIRNTDADDMFKSKGRTIEPDKIILLVKDEDGYQNILKLMKTSYLDNMQPTEKAQISLEDVKANGKGLIALTGGFEGPIGRLYLENRVEEAEEFLLKLKDIFGDRLYMEVSRIGFDDEQKTEDFFISQAYKHNIPLVATNEAFFFDADMYEAHDALVCIAAGEYVANENRKKFSPNNRLRSAEEMEALFSDLPEALQNTVNIARRCNYLSEFVHPLLPVFECGDKTADEFIREESLKGLAKRMNDHVYTENMTEDDKNAKDEIYYSRLDYELSVIKRMGFAGYFLIVSDFIRWSKNNGVPVGPGRGSGAGSIVAWSLEVTDLDPIHYDLLFERFLNPDRISMPDFDVDFCQENREKTIEYVKSKYGADRVAQIITYGKLQSKAVIRDVARVLQMPYSQADRISKMIPMGVQGKNPTLKEALEQVPELEDMRVNDPQINKLFDIAMKLEGLYRHSGVHAAGVVIGDRPLLELVPLYKDPRAEMPVTQFDMKFIEETGLIKFDFLGLKTLTVIKKAIDLIEEDYGIKIDIDKIPMNDKATYELLQRGDTAAVFQFESSGMKDVHKQIKPDRFEDLIAIVSLYRPGPMDNIPSYIKRKHGQEEVAYLHPMLESILAETYGIMIYQEQVMRISQKLANYTQGEADNLRKIMGKKQIDKMPAQKEKFISGAVKNGIEESVADTIFEQMAKFASYGFNKSHAAAYSLISYQTAYLKAHYPVEFMCAVMSLDITNTDKLLFFKDEIKKMGYEVLTPDINKSKAEFSVEDGKIRYALAAIKGVGDANMRAIVEEREKNGKFKNLSDFIHRIDAKQMNRRQLEQLIKSGAFDSLDSNRAKLFDNIDIIIKHISTATEVKTSSQATLFGAEELKSEVKLSDKADWPELDRLKNEADAIGFYLSAHPLDIYGPGMDKLGVKASSEVFRNVRTGDNIKAKLAGCVNSLQKRLSKSGNKYAFLDMSDATGSFEGLIFSEGLGRYEDVINSGLPLLVGVTIDKQNEDGAPRVMINTVEILDKAISEVANGLIISISNVSAVRKLKEILLQDKKGRNKVYIKPEDADWDVRIELMDGFAFANDDILSKIRNISGVASVKEI